MAPFSTFHSLVKEAYIETEGGVQNAGLGKDDGISVLVMTWKRRHLLEEAIESFLRQTNENCEMVIINDDEKVNINMNIQELKSIMLLSFKSLWKNLSMVLTNSCCYS